VLIFVLSYAYARKVGPAPLVEDDATELLKEQEEP
jgi:hypothetical protein